MSKAEHFFSPLILLLIVHQNSFWTQMSQFTTALAQRVDTTKAYVPEIQLFITPKQSSAVNKKYSISTASPWDREPTAPALAYGTTPTPALTAGNFNNTQPVYNTQPAYQQPQTPTNPAAGGVLPQRPPPVQPHNIQPPSPAQHFPQQPMPQPQQHNQAYVPHPGNPQQPVPQQNNQAYVPHPGNPFANPVSTPAANPFAGATPARPIPPPTTKPQARAQWDFAAQNQDEISFKAGDILIIHEQSGDWWRGEIHGRTGLLPANYVQLC